MGSQPQAVMQPAVQPVGEIYNPANDPWRNGMTDDQLMNLYTKQQSEYSKSIAANAFPGLFNLKQQSESSK